MDKVVSIDDYRPTKQEPMPKPAVKKRRLRKSVKRFLTILALVVLVLIFLHSPLFMIKNVEVSGNVNVSKNKIITLAEIPAESNLFWLDQKECAAKIKNYPFIAEVSFKRHLPSTLIIEVSEREPVGFIVTESGYVQFDRTGLVLAVVSSMGSYNLPIVTGVAVGEIPSPGAKLENKSFATALAVIKECDNQLLANIAEINIADSYLLAYTYRGIEIKLGNADNIAERLQALKDIFAQISAEKIDTSAIEYIDIRYSDVPVIKFKDKKSAK